MFDYGTFLYSTPSGWGGVVLAIPPVSPVVVLFNLFEVKRSQIYVNKSFIAILSVASYACQPLADSLYLSEALKRGIAG